MGDAFRLARKHGVDTIAIPAVCTGIAGFAMDGCARVLARGLGAALISGWATDELRFWAFG